MTRQFAHFSALCQIPRTQKVNFRLRDASQRPEAIARLKKVLNGSVEFGNKIRSLNTSEVRRLTATMPYWDDTPYVEYAADATPTYVEHHRTLGERVREIAAAGFRLLDIVEPQWPPGHTQEWGQWSPLRGAILPGTAIYVCELGDCDAQC